LNYSLLSNPGMLCSQRGDSDKALGKALRAAYTSASVEAV